MLPDNIEPHQEIVIKKSKMPRLPEGFEEITAFFGDKKDAIRQYRGPNNIHVLEYEDHWKVHWDCGDPRTIDGAIIHIFADAPEIGFTLLAATLAGKKKYDETHSIGDSIIEALLAGLFTYGGVVVTKEVVRGLKSLFADGA
ncbi:MAG: hypothetical protein ACTSWA_07405 [Candidatus Thorarchaeota archaeon]